MKKLGGLLAGILCMLCLLTALSAQKADAEEMIYRASLGYSGLVAGMPRKYVTIKHLTGGDGKEEFDVDFYILQNGKMMGDNDVLNSQGKSVTVVVTFTPKEGYRFVVVGNSIYAATLESRTYLFPENNGPTTIEDIYALNPDNFQENSDGSFTATWNAVPVPKPASPVTVFGKNAESFIPAVGEYPTEPNATLMSQSNHCKLVKYEWQENWTAYTGKVQQGKYYRLVLWLEASDGYAFGSSTKESYWKDTTGEITLAHTEDEGYTTWIYRVPEHPDNSKKLVFGKMVRLQIDFEYIVQHPVNLLVSPGNATLTERGKTLTLSATVLPANTDDKRVTWESTDTKVATVSASGVVTPVGNGKCNIVARTVDKPNLTASCELTVDLPPVAVKSVKLNKTSLTLKKGAAETLTATVSPKDAANKKVTWTSSNKKIATVNSSGKVTAVAVGKATIIVTTVDGGKTAVCNVTVTEPVKFPFTDVTKKDTYYDAVYWAYVSGIVKGKSKTTYAPKDGLTRGEFCTMLWRMWGKQTVSTSDVDAMPFADAKKSNHKNGIAWCYNQGIIKGYKDGTFKPSARLSRANIIVMLYKLAKQENSFKEPSIKNPYTDVKDSHKNISAYKWAYENKLVTSKKLRSGDNCTRAEMATFLYEYNNTYKVIK